MSALISPRLELECKVCGYRPPTDATMEAVALHFNVEHDSDAYELNLSAVCDCGATMRFVESKPTGGGFFDYFHCDACGLDGRVKRAENPAENTPRETSDE